MDIIADEDETRSTTKTLAPNKEIASNDSNHKLGSLKGILINARSINNKLSNLKALLHIEKPDLLAVTETWLSDFVLDAELQVPGYNFFRKDRKGRRGGGVLLFIKDDLKVEHLENFSANEVESIWCLLKLNNISTRLGLFYRPPSYNAEQDKMLFDEIRSHLNFKNTIIMGDFNFPCIDWKALTSTHQSKDFLDLCLDNFLVQMVHDATRNQNILDIILTSDESLVTDVHASAPFCGSDHNAIYFSIPGTFTRKSCNQVMPNFNKANFNEMRKNLPEVNWHELLDGEDTESCWNLFKIY